VTKPQPRELRRSGLGNTDQEALEMMARESEVPEVKGRTGRVPEDNRPGHHPLRWTRTSPRARPRGRGAPAPEPPAASSEL
jgi:hypothetical protein